MSDETQITITSASFTQTPTTAAAFAPEPPGPVPAPAPRKRGAFPTRPSSSAVVAPEREQRTVYEIVTSQILKLLERGTVPWRAGWTRSGLGEPRSATTGKAYRGINSLLLSMTAHVAGYRNDSWITFRQAKELGGTVRKGEKGSLCVFWRVLEDGRNGSGNDESSEGEPDSAQGDNRRFVLRYYTVFNIEQCEGLPVRFNADPNAVPKRRIIPCEQIVSGLIGGPLIEHGFNAASYSPGLDRVAMPAPGAFQTSEGYYATLFHELTHASGHPTRLARLSATETPAPFGSPDYSREELVAEMGSAFLCAEAGISCATIENQAAYVAGWVKTLQGDARAVVIAAAQAQRAADHILGRTHDMT